MISPVAERLRDRFYRDADHPYRILEQRIDSVLTPDSILLDAGCGRTAPLLRRYIGRARRLIGIDVVPFTDVPAGMEMFCADLANMPLDPGSVDVIVSRSVFEHLSEPARVYAECARVLRPGGVLVFLTANMWDYATLIARVVPNRFHAPIVKVTEGRAEEDTFPTAYRTNTRRDVQKLADEAGLKVVSFEYLSQYPNYLMFNGFLFFLGMCYEKTLASVPLLRALRGWILVTMRKPAT